MAKKTKAAKPAKKGKAGRRPVNQAARLSGSIAGLLIAAYACLQLLTNSISLEGAGKLAILAIITAIVIEKMVFPLGAFLMGPPASDPEPTRAEPANPRRR